MTTRTSPSPTEILADRRLRQAVEAGSALVVFDAALGEVLMADAEGRALLGLGKSGDVGESGASPALRQVRSAARILATKGEARLVLRQSTRTGTRTLAAELLLRPAGAGADGPAFALLCVAGIGRDEGPGALVEMAGLGAEAVAVFSDGTQSHATPAFASMPVADLADRIAGFGAADADSAVEDDGAVKLTLVKAAFGRILAWAEASERVADTGAAEPTDAASDADAIGEPPAAASLPDAPAPSAGFSTFSVKRAKLGQPRGTMSMSALLQRWHSRGPADDQAASPVDELLSDGAATSDEFPAPAERPDVSSAEVDAPPSASETARPSRQRSLWGAPVPPVAEEQVARDAEPAIDARERDAEAEAAPAIMAAFDSSLVPAPVEAAEQNDVEVPGSHPIAPSALDRDEREAGSVLATSPANSDREPIADAPAAERPTDPVIAVPSPSFTPRFDLAPVRFVWQIDREGAFRFLSPDFAGAVGGNAADVVGRSFADVARVFGFDGTGEIARLLERRDTWSGRTIFWPVEGSDRKVPVDLAALPVYGRDRSFDGFRGFGIVRLGESVADEESLGLLLTSGAPPRRTAMPQADGGTDADAPAPATKPFLRRFEAESFGRRAAPPQPEAETAIVSAGEDAPASDAAASSAPQPNDTQPDDTQKVIRLEERRRPREGALSTAEEAAFRAIGAKLGSHAEAESPGALRFEDTEPATAPCANVAGMAANEAVEAVDRHEEAEKFEQDAPAGSPRASQPSPTSAGEVEERPGSDEAGAVIPAGPSSAEADAIEPALAALSARLSEAEAEADRLLAARRSSGAATETPADEASTEPSTVAAAGVEVAEAIGTETAGTQSVEDEVANDDGQPSATAPSDSEAEPDIRHEAEREGDDWFSPDPDEALDLGTFERLFASLPLAVLVQMREQPVYANGEFTALTGHADAASVAAAGGLDALILDRKGEGTLALRRADGEIVEVRAHMQRIAEGGRSALLMSFVPVAEPLPDAGPALDDLRQEVEELQAVLDTATDGVVLLDVAGQIRAMNGSAHALFGIGADEAFGRHLSSLFAHESQQATVDYLEMLRDDGIGGILNDGREVIGRVSQGGFIPLFITIGRLSGERGWCVVIRDIAHWKRIEEDLVNARRQAEAASLHKSRFLANISHELRTPLNAIIGFADVMSSECFGPIGNERYLEYLGDIKRSGHHVLDLVNDLLDISKIEAGKIDLSFEAVSLNEVVSEVVSLMQPQANRERVIVRSNLPSSVPPVVADRRTMRQIALNLVANAIRFTPAGGQIIASTTYTAEGDVLLRFRDSGIGMTEREIELALTPFQQVHAPSANRGEGTGLGLPLTKAMVEANRAQFAIHSTPGEGTLVEIAFPAPRVLAD